MFDDFYQFSGRPFQLTPDAAFFFESLTHRKALSYLGYGLAQGEGFVVITGEVGAGKSTLVAHLMATIDPARQTAAQIVTSRLDGDDLVHVVAQAFGLIAAFRDKAAALGAIETFLHEEARAGRRCLLIVDEVQNLSIAALEELRMLSNFQLGAHPLLQVVLLGQPEFRVLLLEQPELEQLRQRVIATHHLGALEPPEVQTYVEHRLARVGWTGNPAFEPAVHAALHAATGGIPRRINQVVSRLLLLGAMERRNRIDTAMLDQVLAELQLDGAVPRLAEPAAAEPAAAEPAAAEPRVSVTPVVEPVAAPEFEVLPAADCAPDEAGRMASIPAPLSHLAALEGAPADYSAQIDELQRAVLELADSGEARRAADSAVLNQIAELAGRIAALEGRMIEQDRTLRYTLTMMIEWIEADGAQRAAVAA